LESLDLGISYCPQVKRASKQAVTNLFDHRSLKTSERTITYGRLFSRWTCVSFGPGKIRINKSTLRTQSICLHVLAHQWKITS